MKRTVLLACIFIITAVFGQRRPTSDVESHIHHVEAALLPAVVVKGEPPAAVPLAERMQRLHVPGISVALIHDGHIEWARGFGETRIDGPPVTTETLFQAGSISKPVAAMAALKLVEMGKLSLDADVNSYLTSWKVPENEFTRQHIVTLREILTHTAGFTVHGFPGYAAGDPVPTLVQVINGDKPANTAPIRVDVVPGTIERYSGGGFTVMQQMMIDVTHKPFPQIMQELVLKPLGMTHSTYAQPLPAELRKNTATPYYPALKPVPGGPHTYPEMAAAGLWTTASDLATFAISVQEGLEGKRNPVLSQAMMRQMVSRQFHDEGLSWGVRGEGNTVSFSHGGVDEGFDAFLFAYASTGDGAAIMTNANGGMLVATEVLRAIAHEYGWPDYQPEQRAVVAVDERTLRSYIGTYALPEDAKIEFTLHVGKLRVEGEPAISSPVDLEAGSDSRFFTPVTGAWFEFTPGKNGTMTLTIKTSSGEVKGERVASKAAVPQQ